MKTRIIPLFVVWALILGAFNMPSYGANVHENNNDVKLVGNFHDISLFGNKNTTFILRQLPEDTIDIQGCIPEKVTIEKSDSTMIISTLKLDTINPIQITLSAPGFQNIDCSFAKLLCKDTIKSDSVKIWIMASDAKLAVKVKHLDLKYEGPSLVLVGSSENSDITFNGFSGDIKKVLFDANNFKTQNLRLSAGVSSSIHINVTDSVLITGGIDSDIHIYK